MPDVISAMNKKMRDGKGGGKSSSSLESVRIEPAEGGWTCYPQFKAEEKKEKQDNCCISSYEPPKPMVFTDKDKLLQYLGGLL